jgi:epsilon-lactone hydrolase
MTRNSATKFRNVRAGALKMLTLLAGLLAVPALAQSAPAPQHNILTWPLPDTVSPEGRAMTAALAQMPMPDSMPPIAVQRQMMGGLQEGLGAMLQRRHGVRIEAATIAGVPVRIIYPRGVRSLGRGPVLLNLHGGGFQVDSGSLTETIPIAALAGIPVVAVRYRLAPEHPFPAALDDALAVYQALEKDRKASRIAVFGTSAGAVLGGQLIARLASLRRPMPSALGFFSGSADLSVSGDSESWMPLPGGEKTLAAGIGGYVGEADPRDPILSPMQGKLAEFPPTLLVSSTRDMLLSGTVTFGRALLEQGVDARLVVFDGLPHAFWAFMDIPETAQANALMAGFLKSRVGAR